MNALRAGNMTLNGLAVAGSPLAATTTPTLFYRAPNGSLINATPHNPQQSAALAAFAVAQQLTATNTPPTSQTSTSPPSSLNSTQPHSAQSQVNMALNGQRFLRPTTQQSLVQQATQLQHQQHLQNSFNLQNQFVNLAALTNQSAQSIQLQQQSHHQQHQQQQNSVLAALTSAALNAQRQPQFSASPSAGTLTLPPGYALYAQPDAQLIHDPRLSQLLSTHPYQQLNVNNTTNTTTSAASNVATTNLTRYSTNTSPVNSTATSSTTSTNPTVSPNSSTNSSTTPTNSTTNSTTTNTPNTTTPQQTNIPNASQQTQYLNGLITNPFAQQFNPAASAAAQPVLNTAAAQALQLVFSSFFFTRF